MALLLPTAALCLHAAAARQAGAQPVAASPAPAPVPISLFGEMRTRSELDHPGGALRPDFFTYLRTRFGARVDVAQGVHVVAQLQDSRVLGAQGASAAATHEFDLHQGYVELSTPVRAVRLAARAGRQEIALGNERLVGAVNWSNVGRSFDGVRVLLAPAEAKAGSERWTTTLFAATVEERGRHFGGAAAKRTPSDHVIAGLFATRVLPGGALTDGTLLYDGGGTYRGYERANRATLDLRVRVPRALGMSLELEGALQAGRQRDMSDSMNVHLQDVRAWMGGVRLGTPAGPARRGAVTVGADLTSGDASPHDTRYGAFSTMYGSNHLFYGPMDIVLDPATATRERGLADVFAKGSLTLSPTVSVRAEVHRFRFASGSTRDMGWEADVTVPIRFTSTAGVDLGYSAFRSGADASQVGLGLRGAMRDWAYAQLRVAF